MNEVNANNPPVESSTLTDVDILSAKYDEPVFIVPKLIPPGLTIFAGKPKTKKSLMALDMCYAVASGGRFLDEDVEPQEVLYLALEDSEPRIQARLRTMIGDSNGTGKLYFETKWPRLDEGGLENLEKWLLRHPRVKLIIIDTLNKIRGFKRSGSSIYEKDYAEIGKLKNFSDKFKIAVILIHHLRKSESQDILDMISGSIGLAGAADTLLVLKKDRGQDSASLFVTGRDIEDKNMHLKFNNHSLSWETAADYEKISPERAAVLNILTQKAEPMKLSDIATAVGKKLTTVYKLVSHLVESNDVERTGYGLYKIICEPEVEEENESGNNPVTASSIDPNEDLRKMIQR